MSGKKTALQILLAPWTIWCFLVFILLVGSMFPILVLIVVINNPKLIRWAHYLPHYLSILLLLLWGIRLKIKNRDFIQPDTQFIYISNHRSYLDALVSSGSIPNFVKFLGKAEIRSWPVLGYLMDKFYVGVQRDDDEDRQRSMLEMQEKLKTGASFYICPEGTCNTTASLLKYFHNGAFRLAIRSQLPIVPLTFVGTGEAFPRHGLMIMPKEVTVYWAEPISTIGLTETQENIEALKETCKKVMLEKLQRHYPSGRYTVEV